MKAFRPLSTAIAERVRALSLSHYQDAFSEAESVADAALHEVAHFASSMRASDKGDVEKLAALSMIAHEAEQRRGHAHRRLLYEWCEYVRGTLDQEGRQ